MRRLGIALAGLAAVSGAALALAPAGADRVAYLKTEDRNRLMIYAAPPDTPPAALRDLLAAAMWTDGRLTLAYAMPPEAAALAAGAVALAGASVVRAAEGAEAVAPAYLCRMTRGPDGARAFAGPCGNG